MNNVELSSILDTKDNYTTSVLIANDSPMLVAVLKAIIATDPRYHVCACVENGKKAVDFFQHSKADIVLMDIHMPIMGGVSATEHIVTRHPKTRILIVTATVSTNMGYIFSALNIGALDYVQTPTLPFKPGTVISKQALKTNGARLLSKLDSLTKLHIPSQERSIYAHPVRRAKVQPQNLKSSSDRIIVIGASTGGPSTLALVLNKLTAIPKCPIIICQHIEPGFSGDFASWLEVETGIPTQLAKDHTDALPGRIYIAPAGRNLGLTAGGRLEVSPPPSSQIFTPNIDYTFFKFSKYYSDKMLGIVLTGMGSDGSKGAKEIIDQGGSVLTQDSETALIESMPENARDAIKTSHSYMPNQITMMMERWMNKPAAKGA